MSTLAPSLQAYFTERLIGQRAASPNTIAAYKLTFRLLLGFASKVTGKAPSRLDIADLDAPLVASFLDHLEQNRHNSAATRNNRLAAVHSLFGYLALHHPEHAATIGRVLAVPPKRTERNLVTYLTDAEAETVLGACDKTTWTGRRDHAMFSLTVQTGLRISELAALTRDDITIGPGANVHTVGKGRKERRTPLISSIAAELKAWLREQPGIPDTGGQSLPGRAGRNPGSRHGDLASGRRGHSHCRRRWPEEANHSVPRHVGAICGLRTSRAAGRFGMLAFRSSGHGREDHGLPCRCDVAGGWVRRRVYRPRRGPAAWLRLPG
jgi:integrase/recombinase XerD